MILSQTTSYLPLAPAVYDPDNPQHIFIMKDGEIIEEPSDCQESPNQDQELHYEPEVEKSSVQDLQHQPEVEASNVQVHDLHQQPTKDSPVQVLHLHTGVDDSTVTSRSEETLVTGVKVFCLNL